MRATMPTLVLCLALSGLAGSAALAAGSTPIKNTEDADRPDPETQADEHFNKGLTHRDEAWELQAKLDSAPEDQRAKIATKIRTAYEHAVGEFRAAVELNPRHHQALGSLGYAYRQLGRYESALEAYDAALDLDPDYSKAIEYRGEAYLGLNRINEAQNAYRVLSEKDPGLAAELLGAMQSWVAARRTDPAGVDVAVVNGFERWIEDRGAAASGSSLHKSRSW